MRDAASIVAQNQDVTGVGTGNLLSQFSMDLGVAGTPPDAFQAIGNITADLGRGKSIFSECRITTSFTSGTSAATVKAQVVQATTADLATSLDVLMETDAILVTTLAVNYRFRLGGVPAGVTKRFLGFRLVIAVEALTAGQFWAEFAVGKIDKPV